MPPKKKGKKKTDDNGEKRLTPAVAAKQLLDACEQGELDKVKLLLKEKFANAILNKSHKDGPYGDIPEGIAPIEMAARHGKLEVVKYLLEEREATLRKSRQDHVSSVIVVGGFIAVNTASSYDQGDVVKYLLEKIKATKTEDEYKEAVAKSLEACMQQYRLDLADYLWKTAGAKDIMSKESMACLMINACMHGYERDVKRLKFLLEVCQVSPTITTNGNWKMNGLTQIKDDSDTSEDVNWTTPLRMACGSSHAKMTASIEVLLAYEEVVATKDTLPSKLAFMEACRHHRLGAVEKMLEKGWDATMSMTYEHDENQTPLKVALKWKSEYNMQIVPLLIQHGAKVTTDHVRAAAGWGDLELVKLLIKEGGSDININERQYNRHTGKHDICTPLDAAVLNGRMELTKFLLEQGADLHEYKTHYKQRNCLLEVLSTDIDLRENKFDMIKYLWNETDLNFGLIDADGDSVLHHAAVNGHVKTIGFLLKPPKNKQRDPTSYQPLKLLKLKNKEGKTPLEMVQTRHYQSKQHKKIIEILEKILAKHKDDDDNDDEDNDDDNNDDDKDDKKKKKAGKKKAPPKKKEDKKKDDKKKKGEDDDEKEKVGDDNSDDSSDDDKPIATLKKRAATKKKTPAKKKQKTKG